MKKRDLFNFYCNHLANFVSGGTLVNRGNLSSLGIRPLFSQIVTKNYIKKVICIVKIPIDYNELLLETLNEIVFKVNKSNKVYLNTCGRPVDVPVSSQDFKRKMGSAEETLNNYNEKFNEMSESEQLAGKTVINNGYKFTIDKRKRDKLQESFDSYKYSHEVIENGGKFAKTYTFIELLCCEQKDMNKVIKEVMGYLSSKNFIVKELSANSSYYLSNYSPASKSYENESKEFSPLLLSDENLSYLQPFNTDGFIGDGNGQLIGMNAGSKTPFILNFFESGARQIVFINSESGHGKTVQAFQIAISMLSSGVHVSALDVKGNEWTKLIKLLNLGVVIDVSETSNSFVNTLRLDDLDVSSAEEAREYYNMAINATSKLLELITKPSTSDEEIKCRHVARETVKNLFNTRQINPLASKTFSRTADLKYENLISPMADLKKSPSNKTYYETIDKMMTLCNSKFRKSEVFKGKEITLSEIVESPLVVYSLNKNKDTDEDDEAIRTFMISFLDMKKIYMRKKMKKFTCLFYEEIQRKEEFKSLMKMICGMVTGARSSNVTVVLLCNSIQILKGEDMAPITSNISTALIGPMRNEDDFKVLKSIGLKDLESKVRVLSKNPKKSRHFFAVKFDTGKTDGTAICKCVLPAKIIKGFETRDVMK